MSKPHAIPLTLVCSECDLDWSLHPENPTKSDCIELLKSRREVCTLPHYFCSQQHYPQPIISWYSNNTSAADLPPWTPFNPQALSV